MRMVMADALSGRNRVFTVEQHYDLLVTEGDDSVYDPPQLRAYMDRYDGEPFFAQFGDIGGARVLEIGVGTGRLATKVLKFQPALLVGVDVSGKALARCGQNTGNPPNLELHKVRFPYWRTAYLFDVIYSSQTFMHIENLHDALVVVANLLSSNGRAVISFANCEPTLEFGDRLIPLCRHDPAEILATADHCGLSSSIQDLSDENGVVAWLWTGTKNATP